MRRVRTTTVALLAAATVVGGSATAFAHGPGRGGPGVEVGPAGERGPAGDRGPVRGAPVCTVPDAKKLTTETSPALARLDRRLDAAVAKGRITQAQADARFARAVTRLSVAKIVNDARIAPVLALLDMTAEELRDAREDGTTVGELLEEKGVTRAQYRAAVREGRREAPEAFETLCPAPEDDEDASPAV